MPETTDYEKQLRVEIAAIRRIVATLDKLDTAVQQRIVRYLVDRYPVTGTLINTGK